jgi:hypothetical protein
MSSVTAIKTMLERLGFSDAAAAYLTGDSGIDSLDEIRYLDGIDDIDSTIKGVTNPGGTVTTVTGTSRVTSRLPDDNQDEDESSDEEKGTSNRSNAALTRQSKKKKRANN